MTARTLTVEIKSTTSLLMRSGRMADPENPMVDFVNKLAHKSDKTKADLEKLSHAEWLGAMWSPEGRTCLIAEAIEAMLFEAGKKKTPGEGCSGRRYLPFTHSS